MYSVYDVSSFLHSISKDQQSREVNGFKVAGLEKLLYKLIENQFTTNVLVMDPSRGNGNPNRDLNGYKGNREPKSFEISKLEEFLKAFEKELNVHIIQTDEEADDVVYSVAKVLDNRGKKVNVYSDDIDLSACVVSPNVTKIAVSRPHPTITFDNYKITVARTFIPNNMVAYYLASNGKASDNIPAEPRLNNLMKKCYDFIQQTTNQLVKNMYIKYASEYATFKRIVEKADLTEEERTLALERAEYLCCRHVDLPSDLSKRIPNTVGIYSMLSAINSYIKPRNISDINISMKNNMLDFLGSKPADRTIDSTVIDLSGIDLSRVFGND